MSGLFPFGLRETGEPGNGLVSPLRCLIYIYKEKEGIFCWFFPSFLIRPAAW